MEKRTDPVKAFRVALWFSSQKSKVEIDLARNWMALPDAVLRDLLDNLPRPENWDYSNMYGQRKLREHIAQQYDCDINNVIITHGAQEALFLISLIFGKTGVEVVTEQPIYHIKEMFEDRNTVVKGVALSLENAFQPQLSELEALLTKQTLLVALNHPHNPSGSMINREKMLALVRRLERRGIPLLVDEVYREICFMDQSHVPPPIATIYSEGISVNSLSKAYGVPGLRVGWIVGPKDLIAECGQLREYTTSGNSIISEMMALEILQKRSEILSYVMDRTLQNLHLVGQWLEAHSQYFDWVKPQGGFSFFPQLKIPVSDEQFCSDLLENTKVLLLPGSLYDCPGHVRIGLVQPIEEVKKGFHRIESFLHNQWPV